MVISKANYYDISIERDFMSRSQYLGWLECEAKQAAILAGKWVEEPTEAMLVGQYVHAWCEGKREQFISEHPEMFTKAGSLRYNFRQADHMIDTLKNDPLCMYTLEGEKEVCFTAEFARAKWRVLLDVYNPARRRIVDLKTTRSIWGQVWCEEKWARVSFIEKYKYILQAALYCEIERIANGRPENDWFDFYMVAVSKDNIPDKEVIDLRDPDRYKEELEKVKFDMGRILAIKAGDIKPHRCESCDYCRSTKVLAGAIYYMDI